MMNAEEMETEVMEFPIEFGLYESCMQNRIGYKTGISPNHWIPGRDYSFRGHIEFSDRDTLKPGDVCKATIKCLIAAQDRCLFVPGFAWHVCEANKIVGYAKVLS